jgi:hypothetical protein
VPAAGGEPSEVLHRLLARQRRSAWKASAERRAKPGMRASDVTLAQDVLKLLKQKYMIRGVPL